MIFYIIPIICVHLGYILLMLDYFVDSLDSTQVLLYKGAQDADRIQGGTKRELCALQSFKTV